MRERAYLREVRRLATRIIDMSDAELDGAVKDGHRYGRVVKDFEKMRALLRDARECLSDRRSAVAPGGRT